MDFLTKKAMTYAIEKHQGQFRKGNNLPFVSHPIEVYSIVKKYKDSREIDSLCAAALLHDVVEDTDTPIQEISKEFSPLVAALVSELTNDIEEARRVGKTNYMIEKVMNLTSWALVIKLADMIANMSDNPRDKAIKRTKMIVEKLTSERTLSRTQWQLCFELERVLREIHGGE